ncbi:MAG: HAMP domain-containing histidine kinase [Clostridia bacterium]|nr:HAMP domain-containing histidine kinase [Clostridia bacterium]
MKRRSIKFRITAYFTLLMFLLAVVLLTSVVSVSRRAVTNELKETLRSAVDAAFSEICYVNVDKSGNTSAQKNGTTEALQTASPTFSEKTADSSLSVALLDEEVVYFDVFEVSDSASEDGVLKRNDVNGVPPEGVPPELIPPDGVLPEDAPPTGEDFEKGPNNGQGKPFDKVNFSLSIPNGFSYVREEVYIYMQETESGRSYGALPASISSPASLADGTLKTVKSGKNSYYVFSKFLVIPGRNTAGTWVIGAVSSTTANAAIYRTINWVILFIPFVILVSALLGYLITKKAFKPVSQITEAANRIGDSEDLSARIALGEGNDEIYTLAATFDKMLGRLEQNFKKEKQFTADASHELRTPTAVIMAQSEYALTNLDDRAEVESALDSIHKQSKKMNVLISELLSLSRADSGVVRMAKEKFDLSELAQIVAEEMSLLAEEKEIEIKTDIETGIEVFADQNRIMRVILNLVSNAVKYGKQGGFVLLTLKAKDGKTLCSVKDDGIGVSKENLSKVWDRFFRVDASRTEGSSESMGLGLSIVKSTVTAHGGTVFAESVEGEGSTFGFTLPLE